MPESSVRPAPLLPQAPIQLDPTHHTIDRAPTLQNSANVVGHPRVFAVEVIATDPIDCAFQTHELVPEFAVAADRLPASGALERTPDVPHESRDVRIQIIEQAPHLAAVETGARLPPGLRDNDGEKHADKSDAQRRRSREVETGTSLQCGLQRIRSRQWDHKTARPRAQAYLSKSFAAAARSIRSGAGFQSLRRETHETVTSQHYAKWIARGYRRPMEVAEGEVPADLLARLESYPQGDPTSESEAESDVGLASGTP